jgi:glycosyltransferase involved in cell wall biosynthesis
MIVKNEAHCIEKSLISIRDYISYWIICDTGSTDNTEEIVRKTLKDIPGEYHYHPWKNFSYNRNLALNLSKQKGNYSFILDADDYLIVEDSKIFFDLNKPAYLINIHHANTIYPRIQLVNNSISAKFIGAVHEYLELSSQPILLDKCYINYTGNGARSKDPNKYLNDAEILKQSYLETNFSRDAFYCAQSYRDAGKFDQAIEYYLLRANLKGWDDEVYQSFLNIGKIMEYKSENFESIFNFYMRAINTKMDRIEGYYYLAKLCRLNTQYDLAYFYSKLGSSLKPKVGDLFLEVDCYWKIIDELAIAAYWIGKIDEARTKNILLLDNNFVPKEDKERIRSNLQFCY